MPSPGPWIQPPDETLTQLVSNGTALSGASSGAGRMYFTSDDTDAGMWAGSFESSEVLTFYDVTDWPADPIVNQQAFAVLEIFWVVPQLFPTPDFVPSLPYPLGAVGYETDALDVPDLRWPFTLTGRSSGEFEQNGSVATAPDPGDGTVVYKRLLPADYFTTPLSPGFSPDILLNSWMTPTDISPRATVFDIPIHGSVVDQSTSIAEADLDPSGGIALWVGPGYFVDAVAPVCKMLADGIVSVTFSYRPRRYRWLFDSYLRVFPRDDDLGMGSRRSQPSSVTVQSGVRSLPANAVF